MSENGDRPELPEGWEWRTVGDVALECRRGRPPAYEDGKTEVVNQKCIRSGTHIDLGFSKRTNESTKALPDWALLREGDILVNSTGTGTLGRVGWLRGRVEGRMTCDTHVTLVRPDLDRVRAQYLGWFLHSIEPFLVEQATGSTNQKELGRETIKAAEFPLPPLSTQDGIVLRLERRIALVEAGISDLDVVAATLGVLGRRSLEESLHVHKAELPSGWEWRSLSDIAKLSAGGTPSRKRPEYFGGEIPWIKIGDLNEHVVTQAEESVTPDGIKNSSADVLEPGVVMLAMYGASIGRTSVLGVRAATNQAICSLRANDDVIDTAFLHLMLKANKAKFVAAGYGGAQPNISQRFLKSFVVPVPPLAVQQDLCRAVVQSRTGLAFTSDRVEAGRRFGTSLRRSILQATLHGGRPLVEKAKTIVPIEA